MYPKNEFAAWIVNLPNMLISANIASSNAKIMFSLCFLDSFLYHCTPDGIVTALPLFVWYVLFCRIAGK